jgi:hypothetical protein
MRDRNLEWILYFKGSLSLDDLKEAIEISLEDEILAFGRLAEGEFGEFLVIVPPGCHRRVGPAPAGPSGVGTSPFRAVRESRGDLPLCCGLERRPERCISPT